MRGSQRGTSAIFFFTGLFQATQIVKSLQGLWRCILYLRLI